jgi:hypothetical protein
MSLARQTAHAPRTERIQFIVPQMAIDAVDVSEIVHEATEDGVARPLIDAGPFGTHAGWARVICTAEMALRLVCAWREAAGTTTINAESEERLAALRHAAVAAYRAYRAYDAVRGKPGERTRR